MGFLTNSLYVRKEIPGADQLGPGGGQVSLVGPSGTKRDITDAELLKIDRSGPPYARLALDALAEAEAAATWAVWGPVAGKARHRALEAKAAILRETPGIGRREVVRQLEEDREIERKPGHPWAVMVRQGTMNLNNKPWMQMPGGEILRLQRSYILTLGESFMLLGRRRVALGSGRTTTIPVTWAPIPPTWIETPTEADPFFKLKARGAWEGASIKPQSVCWYRAPGMSDPYARGAGKMKVLAEDLALDEAQVTYLNAVMTNMGEPRTLVVAPGLGPREREEFLQKMQGRGPERAGRVVTLEPPPGMSDKLTVHRLADSPVDLAAYDGRRHNRDAFLHVNRVAPGAVGIAEDVNRANAYIARKDLRDQVTYNLERLRESWQTRFFEPLGNLPAEYAGEDRLVCLWSLDPLRDTELAQRLMLAAPEHFSERDFRELAGLEGGDPNRRIVRTRVQVVREGE